MKNFLSLPVILCVGSVKVVGDSVGPKVGDRLVGLGVKAYVYGKTVSPVNGVNYESYVDFIKLKHPRRPVIAVDACLGKKEDVGKVKMTLNRLHAGAALEKNLTSFGDVTVLAIVGERSDNNFQTLNEADEDFIDSLADTAAKKIYNLIENLRLYYIKRNRIRADLRA